MKMNILYLTYANPEKENRGDHRYSMDTLRIFKQKDTNIHMIVMEDPDNLYVKGKSILDNYCDKVTVVPFKAKSLARMVLSKYPASIANRHSMRFVDEVKNVLAHEQVDVIVVNHFKLAYIIEYLNDFTQKKVVITHDIEQDLSASVYQGMSNLFKKMVYYWDYLKVKHYEDKYIKQYDLITAICDADKNYFSKATNKKTILLTPIVNVKVEKQDIVKSDITHKKVIVCGNWKWGPKLENLKMLLDAKNFNALSEAGIELTIVGHADEEVIREVTSKYNNVKMTGSVDSVLPYYKDADVALVPELLGGGFKLKIAEAVSQNIPFIAIKEGLTDEDMRNGENCICVSNFEEMVVATIALLANKNVLADNARKMMQQKYSLTFNQQKLMDALNSL